ncbi:hypothetical protein [Proteus faecis]|uniref:hypothetical protein n=1 Tax=Proteus faecis TaxID=2050967 RepID=UPI00301DC99A
MLDSFKSELLFVFIFILIQEKKPLDIKFMQQVGENHPHLKSKLNGKVMHVEVTKFTKSDNRFSENFFIHTLQKMLLSMIRLSYSLHLIFDKKSGQFKKWIANGVIKDSDSKIIAIDIG